MQTEKPMIHWGDLFDSNGRPHSNFHEIINERKIPLINYPEIKETVRVDNSLLFWNGKDADTIQKITTNINQVLEKKSTQLNGHATDYFFNGIQLPLKNSDLIWKKLRYYFNREKRRDHFGEWIWKQVQAKNYTIHYLANMIMNIKFDLVYIKDPNAAAVVQLDFPVRREDTGIYFIKEHLPDNPYYGEIIYVGKSFTAMRTTIWCHFHEWKGKYSHTRPKGNRGEDRGEWIEKIQKGYTYSIGTIRVLPTKEGFPGVTDRQVRTLERIFIHLLDPRDNRLDKIEAVSEQQGNLFEAPISTIGQDDPTGPPSSPDDDLPF